MIPNKIVAEYSQSQDAFHVHSLVESIQDGLMACLQKQGNDYCLIGIFDNDEDAHDFINKILAARKDKNRKNIDDLIRKALNGNS